MAARQAGLLLGAASPILALSGWSAWVTHERRQPPPTTDFVVGSTDDLLADKLKTGDLLLFRRDWAMMQPPAAALALATRAVFGTRFDHLGLIIKDRFGTPLVLEVTHRGVRLRRFDERLSWSKSDEIYALPLARAPGEEARARAERYARSLTPERRLKWANPSQSMSTDVAGLVKYVWARRAAAQAAPALGGGDARTAGAVAARPDPLVMGEAVVASRDAALVLAVLERAGLADVARVAEALAPPQLLSPADLADGRLPLTDGNRYMPEEVLLVRLRDRSNRDA